MANCDSIGPIKIAMKLRRDMCGVAAEALNHIFNEVHDDLIEQVRDCCSFVYGASSLVAIARTTLLVPCHVIKPLQLIWWPGTWRFQPQAPDLQKGGSNLTHWGWVKRICVIELGCHWFMQWLVAYSAQSHYLNQWWLIVNLTLRNKVQWNFYQN